MMYLLVIPALIAGAFFRRAWGDGYANYYMLAGYAVVVGSALSAITWHWSGALAGLILAIGWRPGFGDWSSWFRMSYRYTAFTAAAAGAWSLGLWSWEPLVLIPVGLIGLDLPLLNRLVPRDANGNPAWDYKAVAEYINGGVITGGAVAVAVFIHG